MLHVKATSSPTFTPTPSSTPSAIPTKLPTPTPVPIVTLPTVSPSQVRGVDGSADTSYPGIPWRRVGYPTCGWGNLTGKVLFDTIQNYHKQGVRVLLTVCQGPNNNVYDPRQLADAAQGRPDAVQCGNEEMKYDPSVAFLYVQPQNFARFYDACEHAMHAVRSDIPVLLGSLDPHVGGIDYQPLLNQVYYLNQMQQTMNSVVHPGGNWDWHTQTLGLIDSWHNGYPDGNTNSLYHLFNFWAQQFGVNLNGGALGKHLWVVEGTGCFKGCGVDPYNSYQVAVSHVLALITDAQTAIQHGVPIFYFSGKDFFSAGFYWPIGLLDAGGHPKPIRQDLGMGSRVLTLSCGAKGVNVVNQEDLLAKIYSGCALPANYVSVVYS
ncbi:MAG: hypothetical protein NVS4B11_28520 [Ktedonobacteraceae bacterium]